MHPGILVLPALALGLSAIVARFEMRAARLDGTQTGDSRALLYYGLLATAFLWPALSIADGVPSPSASLYAEAPWQGREGAPDPSTGNSALGDVTYQIQPWLLLLRGELRAGELPLWNPHAFLGQPFWANGQSAPLFPLHLLFAALPIGWGFLLLPWLRILIAALGTRRLALALGISPGGALLAGVVYPLSGMATGYLLFPMANALCLVPWVLWATERLAAGRAGWRPLAVCVGLLALGGHPGTLSHVALLSVLYLLVRGMPWRQVGSWLAGWGVGGALAMVQLLPLAFYLPLTARWGDADALASEPSAGPPWSRVVPLVFRLLQPWIFGRAEMGTWHGAFYEPGSRVFVGLATLTLALVALGALVARWRARTTDRRLAAIAGLLVFSALVAYRTPVFVDLVESLPVVGRALPHRLLFAVELCLALLAGAGLDRLTSARRVFAAAALVAAGFAALAGYLAWTDTTEPGEWLAPLLPWLAWLAVAAICLAALATRMRRLLPVLPVLLVAAELTIAHGPSVPGLSVRDLYPETGATRFLAGREGAVAAVGSTLRPNTAIAYGLRDLRGDDPAHPRRYDEQYRQLGRVDTPFFHPLEHWHAPWLDAAAVRWVMTPPAGRGREAADESWHLAYDGDDARVYERPTALPEARLVPAGAALEIDRPSNDRLRVHGSGPRTGRLVVAQAWAPGWQARVSGAGSDAWVDTVADRDFFLAVDLPDPRVALGDPWQVEFVYRPPGLVAGAWLSAAALLWLVAPLALVWRRRMG